MSNWKEVTVAEIAEVVSGATPDTTIEKFWNGNINWITPVDLSKLNTRFVTESQRKISQVGLASCATTTIPPGSLVMSSRAPIGYFAIGTTDFTTNQGCKSFVFKNGQDSEFHYYLFSFHVNKFKQLGAGSTFAEISKTQIEKVSFEIPTSKKEQKKIAKILQTVDGQIEKTEAIISKYKATKQGLMQDLFTRGIDLATGKLRPSYQQAPELYKSSPLGMIPKDWEIGNLRNYISFLRSGLSRSIVDQDIGIPVLISGNLQDGKMDFTSLKYWYQNDPQGANVNNYILNNNDILLCFINSIEQIGKVAIFKGFYKDCIYTTNMFRIKSDHSTDPNFLYYLLSSEIVQSEIKKISKLAVNQASFTTGDFLNIPVPKIKKEEQIQINQKLLKFDDLLLSEDKTLGKLNEIKRGLMSDLLSGKVRVQVDEEAMC